jgi:hypothetical protein
MELADKVIVYLDLVSQVESAFVGFGGTCCLLCPLVDQTQFSHLGSRKHEDGCMYPNIESLSGTVGSS